MATLLDITLLNQFSSVFIILFIFTITYAVLTLTDKSPFKGNQPINAMLAATVAIMFVFSEDAVAIVRDSIPWFVIMMIALIFIFITIVSIGSKVPDIVKNDIGRYSIFFTSLSPPFPQAIEKGPIIFA